MVLELSSLDLLKPALEKLEEGFSNLPPFEQELDLAKLETVLLTVAEKMQDNYPYPHPMYAGQMLKPPHPVARLAYMISLFVNPNNHALDGGRASSEMEKEAVANIAEMLGFKTHLGHLCGGGTMANLEALWVANRLNPDKLLVASQQAHYTHSRLSEVLKIPYKAVPVDRKGKMDLNYLRQMLETGDVGTVVATTGTTAIGSIDPVDEIVKLKEKYNFRLHIDAAYGGYFNLADNLSKEARRAFDSIEAADSLVIDPHKHGLQPYGCGCVLFKDSSVGSLYKHDSPYTYFSSDELHLGEISLECSRPGSSAVALWATQKLLPMDRDGQFAKDLAGYHATACQLYELVSNDDRFIAPLEPELDIVVFAVKAKTASQSSKIAKTVFDIAASKGLHLAVASLPKKLFEECEEIEFDQDHISCLRSCLMKPEHSQWLATIWQTLTLSLEEASLKC